MGIGAVDYNGAINISIIMHITQTVKP